MAMTTLQLSERLIGACVELHGTEDARDVARYVTSLVSQLVPQADGVIVNVRSGDQLFTLGVLGYTHFASTLVIPAGAGISATFWSSEMTWTRTPGELAALVAADDSEAAARLRQFGKFVADTGHRSMVIVPCLLREDFLGCIVIDAWTRADAFHHADITKARLAAQVAALSLAGTSYATVFDERGQAYRRSTRHKAQLSADTVPATDPPTPHSSGRQTTPAPDLSGRELDVLRLILDGRGNVEIADRLFLSVNTVRTHRRNLMSKLGAHNAVELLKAARELGLAGQ